LPAEDLFLKNNFSGQNKKIIYKYFFLNIKNLTVFIPIKYLKDKKSSIYLVQLFHPISENAKILVEIKIINKKIFVYLENEDILFNENYLKVVENIKQHLIEKLNTFQKPILTLYDKINRDVI
jgi:hypothetical protein